MLFLLMACAEAPDGKKVAESGRADEFGGATAVRVESPTNGETVATSFVLHYRAGRDVAAIGLAAEGATVVNLTPLAGSEGELAVTLAEGKVELVLAGYDADGGWLSEDKLTVRVSDGEEWVSITSPANGANVANPVTFTVASGSGITSVDLLADGWPIGTVDTTGDGEGQLTYSFSGTGYAREITAQAGEGAASDTLTLTVEPEETPAVSDFNALVMKYLETYPTDGTNGYYWPAGSDWMGTTRDIWYQDVLVAEGDPEGRCFCVGLTWEVYMRAWEEVDRTTGGDGDINGLSVDDLYTFRVDWFVRELDGAGPSVAMENYGVGEEITDPAKLLPGDFLQFWRHSGSGHNVIFVDWVKQGGEIVGVDYWSTQGSTDGVAYNTEYFGASGSSIDPNLVFAGRGHMPVDWVGWR
jgi:hypothetical protein